MQIHPSLIIFRKIKTGSLTLSKTEIVFAMRRASPFVVCLNHRESSLQKKITRGSEYRTYFILSSDRCHTILYYNGRCRGRELKLKLRFKLLNQSAE